MLVWGCSDLSDLQFFFYLKIFFLNLATQETEKKFFFEKTAGD